MAAFRVRAFGEVASTNDEVKRAIEAGEPEGLAVRARVQTGGYGRQGRAWASPAGGLYCSLLLRPQVPLGTLPTLSLVAALAVRRALARVGVEGAVIKWPNDVMLPEKTTQDGDDATMAPEGSAFRRLPADDAVPLLRHLPAPSFDRAAFCKLCGISLELHAGGVCVGIGVNVARPAAAQGQPPAGANVPAYVAECAPALAGLAQNRALDEVCAALLDEFGALYDAWCAEGFAPLMGEYAQHAALTGLAVEMVDVAGRPLAAGTVTGIDEHGRLLLRDAAGAQVPISSGEAHIR